MMRAKEKPDVTYSDISGCKEQIGKLREVVETPLLSVRHFLSIFILTPQPEHFVNLGIDPPKGVLLFGPPGAEILSSQCHPFY